MIILKVSKIILFTLLLIFVFGLFSVEIWDPDFWWHLKTGEYISQTGSLPETDPFAYTSLPEDPIKPESKRIKFILTQYWFAQLIFYWVYKAFSFQGIIFLRALILTLIIFLIYRGVRREGAGFYTSVVLLIPSIIVFSKFTGERPQLFSFLFAFLLVFLLENFRRRPTAKRYLFPIPLLMLLWANLHGGFILGIVIILGYIFSEVIKYTTKRFGQPLPSRSLKTLCIAGFISILSSLINPNGYNVLPVLIELQKSLYMGMIIEAKSPLILIRSGFYNQELITYVILLSLSIPLLLVNIKRLDLTDVLIFAVLTAMSLSAARVIPFFTPVSTIMIARYAARTIEKLTQIERLISFEKIAERPLSFLKSPLTSIFFSTLLSAILIFMLIKGNLFKSGVEKDRYPEGAVRFLKENRISGNMFNPYVWGGYLIWTLYPDHKVFVDGRGLIEEIVFQGDRIFEASSLHFKDLPEWKAFLNAYNINFILTFSVDEFSGKLFPLIPALLNDIEWHLIYMDNNSLIFLKNSPENMEIINRFGMPKEWLWNEVVMEATIKANYFRRNSNFYITMGDAFFAKKTYQDAKAAYLKAWEINPDSNVIKKRLDLIKAYGF